MIFDSDKEAINQYLQDGVFGLEYEEPHDYIDNEVASRRLREQLGVFGFHDLPESQHDLAEAVVIILDEVCAAWDLDIYLLIDDTGDEVCRICKRVTDYDHSLCYVVCEEY